MSSLPSELLWTVAIYLDRATINSLSCTNTKLRQVFDEKFWYMRAGGARALPQVHVIANNVSWQSICHPNTVRAWYHNNSYHEETAELREMIAIEEIEYYQSGLVSIGKKTSPIREVINPSYYLDEENNVRDNFGKTIRSGVLHCAFSESKALILDMDRQLWIYDLSSFLSGLSPEELIELPFNTVPLRVGIIRDKIRFSGYSYWILMDDNSCHCYLSKNAKGQYNYIVLRDVDSLTTLDENYVLLHIADEYKMMCTEKRFLCVKEEGFEPHFFLKGRPFIIIDNEVFSWKDYRTHHDLYGRREHSFVRFS